MIHSYEVEMAQKYGITSAVLLHNIFHWIERNRVHRLNFHDGRYWTWDTIDTLVKQFPEMSKSTIARSLKKLEEDGVILRGNYNDLPFDRTSWYSLSDEAYDMMLKLEHPYGQNDNMSCSQNDNMQDVKMNTTIPNSTLHIYPNVSNKESNKLDSMSHSESVTLQVKDIIRSWNEMAKRKGIAEISRLSPESNRCRWLKTRIAEYGIDAVRKAIENVGASDYLPNQHWFDFEWFVRPNNFPKVLEGKYGRAAASPAQPDDDFYEGEG